MRLELTREGLLVLLANHYSPQGAQASFVEEQMLYYLTNRWWDKGIYTFHKCFWKWLLVAWLKFELTYYDVAAQDVSHYATVIPTHIFIWNTKDCANEDCWYT